MRSVISLGSLSLALASEQTRSQKKFDDLLLSSYAKTLARLCSNYPLALDEVATMLFCPNYELSFSTKLKVYRVGSSYFAFKRPNFFIRLFRRVTTHKVEISQKHILFDDAVLSDKEIEQLEIRI